MAQTDEYLTVTQLAERYHTTANGVYAMRYRGQAPPARRIGKRILFHLDEVIEWESQRAA